MLGQSLRTRLAVKNLTVYMTFVLLVFNVISLVNTSAVAAQAKDNTGQYLSVDEFVKLAMQHDVVFESILLDQLPLKYRRAILYPDQDILFSVKQQYSVLLNNGHDHGETGIALSKLFAGSGTSVSLDYAKPIASSSDRASLQFMVAQPIAKNAFGKGFQLLDQIIGIENDLIRHQIVEAYEDYLAATIVAYYDWYSSYENLEVGRAALKSSQRLLRNILDRQRQNIALPIDVNKMKLSLINKQENLLLLEESYAKNSNIILKAIRYKGNVAYKPQKPAAPLLDLNFEAAYGQFVQNSRTYQILKLLENKSDLEVKQNADDLLPSTNLLLGYGLDGEEWGDRSKQDKFSVGIEFTVPLGRSVAKANYEISRIQYHKTRLSTINKYEELRVNLKNLFLQIEREQKLVEISLQKIKLSDAILKDEAENYSFGKVTLNDYITAVNTADENRFSNTAHNVQLYRLLIEWKRLTDQLVERLPALTADGTESKH